MTTRVIRIVIDSRGAKKGGKSVETALGGVDKKAKSAEKSVTSVRGALIATAAILVARKVIQIGDAYQSLQGQLRLVTESTRQLESTTQTLFDISNRTRQGIEATSSLYIRLGRSTDFSNERIAQLTETIGQTIAISRAAPEQARAALFQLGQGFAAGALRGEELNSVMEQTPELAKAIADGLGITIGSLRVLGAEGKLTAEAVAGALESAAEDVARDFQEVPLTVGDAITKVGNALTQFIGELDSALSATSLLAKGLDGVAKTILGLGVIIGDKRFSKEIDEVGRKIDDLREQAKNLREEAKFGLKPTKGFLGFAPGDADAAKVLLAEVEAELAGLVQFQQRLFEPEIIRKNTDEAGRIFAGAITDLQEAFEQQQEAADKFAEGFQTPVDKAIAQLERLNTFVRDGLLTDESVITEIRARLDEVIRPLEEIEIKVEKRELDDASQSLLDTADNIGDLQEQLLALQTGGEEELKVTLALQRAKEVIEETGVSAGVTAEALADMFLTEAQLEEEIRKATDALEEQGDGIEDFLTRARENAQDILSGFLSDPMAEGLDELPAKFAGVLQDLSAQLLATEIFKLLGGIGGGASGGQGLLSTIGGFFGGKQEGGPVGAGDFGVVGEAGPEVFQAPAAGTIVPNQAAAPPIVNVNPQVINVQDPADIPAAMQGAEGESVILNVLRNNPDVIRQVAA